MLMDEESWPMCDVAPSHVSQSFTQGLQGGIRLGIQNLLEIPARLSLNSSVTNVHIFQNLLT
jgi:hypothetical protein